ncbi:SAGA-associated factor 29 [Rhypophila decipiens]|uniref:SAGA-associated factor 29 n=1 Tax=Rhypophila decipiens TaxID=261697 RepID=A0AAN6YEA1_9PEZI|nr:SAGA-associated factor 29 [Rhypophila decipiens]
MSSRNRNARPNRNSGSTQGEEAHLWAQIKDDIRTMIEGVNSSNDALRNIIAQDNYISKNKESIVDMGAEESKLDSMLRGSVKGTDLSKQQIDALYEHVTVLRALVKAREDTDAQVAGSSGLSGRERPMLSSSVRSSSARGAEKEKEKERERERETLKERERDKERDPSSVYEFDGGPDSPVPSPLGSHTRKLGGSGGAGSDRSGNRDSIPPRDTPSKGDSVPPEPIGAGSATAAQRAKVTFFKGQDVVFKPKPASVNDTTEWMLGRVQQVLGEGKSRRYKVQDADPDVPLGERSEFRTSASSMIPLPVAGVELGDLEKGKTVLALYPDSTTFYKAEVMGSDAANGKVSLRFEGEENNVTTQLVDRRFVVEYRN